MRAERKNFIASAGARILPAIGPKSVNLQPRTTPKGNLTANNHATTTATGRNLKMASSSAGYFPPLEQAGSSSSSRSPPKPATIDEDSDNDDPVAASFSRDQDLLADNPLEVDGEDIVSFKRKRKQTPGSRFLSAISGNGSNSRQATPSPIRGGTPTLITGRSLGLNTVGASRDTGSNSKDGGSLDWYVEGPGRRVGYQDLTAIDWIFEYTKERQRLRMLYSSASGLFGYAVQFWDASQVWILLILTGLAAGVFAASIDVASDWLGDVKTGYCSAGEGGGHFYLNKYFCCYGYDELAQCGDWIPWSLALHITSAGGKWFIEYFFFIMFSVCTAFQFPCNN
jgi:chloride channel 3/4/5